MPPTVYTACNTPRHNADGWNEVIIKSNNNGYFAHKEKDIKMAMECDFGIMLWNGKSKGTAADIEYLKALGKRVVIISEDS